MILFCIVRGSRPGKNVQLTEAEIRGLCLKSREIFLSQPILLELEAPLKICGRFYPLRRKEYRILAFLHWTSRLKEPNDLCKCVSEVEEP